MSNQTPAGWYPDPDNGAQQRYWNGMVWTDNYAPAAGAQPQPPKKGGVPTGVKALIGIVGALVLMGACGALLTGGETESPTAQATQTAQAADETTTAEEAPVEEPAVEEPAVEEPVVEEEPEEPTLTVSQENALGSADDYLAYQAFSKKGLIEQLEFEGYSTKDATFAVNNVQVNWNEQAAKAAENYLDFQNFSRSGLIEQLEFEGYTTKQATYGADSVGL